MWSLGNYDLGEKLYESADAALYLGKQKENSSAVIIKTHKDEYPTALQIARIRHEYTILQSLSIPSVTQALALEKCGPGVALVLRVVDGVSLSRLLQAGRLELGDALRIGCAIAEVIAQIHERGVIHKDIKPANLMVSPRTHVVTLIDFGISTRLAQQAQRSLSPGAIEGSLAYMSPEQTGRMNRTLDHRTDLYSLGATLYEMLTGKLPFVQTDPMELMHSHIARIPSPPVVVAPDVPQTVSDIVMKLLAKNAEDRYQTARGVLADLQACVQSWDLHRQVVSFDLGRSDHSTELQIPKRLYGREQEVATLFAAFERASQGRRAELLLVSGYSGVGKSMLVHELYKASIRKRSFFVSGKFDQHQRGVPYASLVQSFRELLRQLLSEPADSLSKWRSRLLSALRSNGALLTTLLPELELIIGPQPPVQEVGPAEAQNRFNMVMRSFLHVFINASPPLVLFLDDLQWADSASLKLINMLLTDADLGSLLIIGAYRDNAIDAVHPLTLAINALRKSDSLISELTLQPISQATVQQLLADTLHCHHDHVGPLAQLVFAKTHGNPFFIGQFLRALHDSKLLQVDLNTGLWTWDPKKIEAAETTDNVVELMTAKLRRLSQECQKLLMHAACIGHRFELGMLSVIEEKPQAEVAERLWEALQEGLVLCLDPDSRVLCLNEAEAEDHERVSYHFLHDRVQQAAYTMLSEEDRQLVHLMIGRRLRGTVGSAVREERLFDVVNHLNLAVGSIGDLVEAADLAQLDLHAGRRAKAATAYESASEFLAAGLSLVPDGWTRLPELTFALHMEHAECLFLRGQFEQVELLFDTLLQHCDSHLQRVAVQKRRVVLYSTVGRMSEALQVGVSTLSMLGISLPTDPAVQQQALMAAFAAARTSLGGRSIEEISRSPRLQDDGLLAAMDLALALWAPAVYSSPAMAALIALTLVNLSASRGHGPAAAPGYANYGMILLGKGQATQAAEFGRLALQLDQLFPVIAESAKVHVAAAVSGFFFTPVKKTLETLERAFRLGLEAGDFLFPSVACYLMAQYRFLFLGEVGSLREDITKWLKVVERSKDPNGAACLTIVQQAIACQQGLTLRPETLSDNDWDEEAFVTKLRSARQWRAALFYYCLIRLELSYFCQDYRGGLNAAAEASGLTDAIFGGGAIIHLTFYSLLSLAALWDGADEKKRAEYQTEIDQFHSRLAEWDRFCPGNLHHRYLLASAELARIAGRHQEAGQLYEQAIDSARAGDYFKDEALANELAGRYYLNRQRVRLARIHMTDAHYGYTRIEAKALVDLLTARFSSLIIQTGGVAKRQGTTTTTLHRIDELDGRAAVKASQALSSEVSLEKLLHRLVSIVTENAGAERGALLLSRDGDLWLHAEISANQSDLVSSQPVRLNEYDGISSGIVTYVARTQELVRLVDASRAGAFIQDSYIARNNTKSLLCMPLMNKAKVQGVLYLENNLSSGVFTEDRVELLRIVCAQMAISIENAYLYADLERRIEERTRELRDAQDRLIRLEREAAEVQMAGGFAHEMRNVLASAKMMLHRVLTAGPSGSESLCMQNSSQLKSLFVAIKPHIPTNVRQDVVRIVRELNGNEQMLDDVTRSVDGLLKRGLDITTLIMEYARIGQSKPGTSIINLSELARSIEKDYFAIFSSQDIDLELDVSSDATIQGTDAHFYSILTNLINNSRDAILDNKGARRGKIRVRLRRETEGCWFIVIDNGVGIPLENRSRIFTPFFSTKPESGTGLGLGMLKRLVHLYGGKVEFDSTPGEGTTFSVFVPNIMGSSLLTNPEQR